MTATFVFVCTTLELNVGNIKTVDVTIVGYCNARFHVKKAIVTQDSL